MSMAILLAAFNLIQLFIVNQATSPKTIFCHKSDPFADFIVLLLGHISVEFF